MNYILTSFNVQESGKQKPVKPRAFQCGTSPSTGGTSRRVFSSYEEAIQHLKRSVQNAREMGNRAEEGRAHGDLATVYTRTGDNRAAIYHYQLYLNISQEVGDREGEVRAYSNLGSVYGSCGDYNTALSYHKLVLNIAKEVGDRAIEGGAYGNLGNAYLGLGNFHKAVEYYEERLKIAKEVADRAGEGRAYGNLGTAYNNLSRFREAIDYHECHLKIAKELGDKAAIGGSYCNIGNAYYSLGDFEKATHYIEQYLEIVKELGDRAGEGRAYGNLGNIFTSRSDFNKAIQYHEVRLKIAKEFGDRAGEGRAYCNLGNAHYKLSDLKKAAEYHQLDLKIAIDLGSQAGQGTAYQNLGNVYYSLGYFKKAMDYSERSLEISKEVGDRAGEGRSYGCLGDACYSLGDYHRAITCHKLRLEIAKEIGDKVGEGLACASIGCAYSSINDFKAAIDNFEHHLKVAKETKDKAREGGAYGNLGNAYYELGDYEKATDYQDRHLKIAKALADRDGEGRANYGLGRSFESLNHLLDAVECYQASIKAYNDVRARLQSKDEWKINLRHAYQTVYTAIWRVLLKQGKVTEALVAAEQGRAQALKDLLEMKYGCELGLSKACNQQETLSNVLCTISAQIVFLAVRENTIFFWVCGKGEDVHFTKKEILVDPSSLGNEVDPWETLIQNACNEIGALVRGPGVKCEDRSLDVLRGQGLEIEDFNQTAGDEALQFSNNSLQTLYNVVIGPIVDLIQGEELIIVPDGPLSLAPFAAFLDPESKYLHDSFRLRVIPSLTSLKMITDCPAGCHEDRGALLVGDPYVQEVVNEKGEIVLKQLPDAREEVEIIGRILKTAPLTGKEATKEEVLKRLSSVAVVHIAAHGSVETGEIALAPNPTRKSRRPEMEDFLLTITDVLNAQLRAKLVVLSCCHSGRGKIKAEGVVGIARAFLGAGARSILVSLWAIDDEATLEFMKNFYQALASRRRASDALNQAMKCMRKSEQFNHEKYWAPFVLIGDDIELECDENE